LFGHAVWRSLALVALGVFLSSAWSPRTNFTFVNVLAQIGLGYWFVALFLDRPPAAQWVTAPLILLGYWALFALYPLPPDAPSIPATALEPYGHPQTGFAAHWEKYDNVAAAFDRWFLNLFPRPEPFRINEGGYQTLNFVPSIATMLFGVVAGQWLRTPRPGLVKVVGLIVAGAVSMAAGTALEPFCPIVKRIWTPTWVLYSTAWTCWLLAFFHGVIDVAGWRRWSFPMVVVGMNSIAMYVMAQLMKPWVRGQLRIHAGTLLRAGPLKRLGAGPDVFSGTYGPIVESVSVLLVLWLICLWLYRKKIFVRL
jgi:predicted acyltransferase